MRELRRMQDTVRDELEHVLHPDFQPPSGGQANAQAAAEETDHAALPPGALPDEPPAEDVTDDGFAGPRSFS